MQAHEMIFNDSPLTERRINMPFPMMNARMCLTRHIGVVFAFFAVLLGVGRADERVVLGPVKAAFTTLALSPSGDLVAMPATIKNIPTVFVWNTKTGMLQTTLRFEQLLEMRIDR